MLGTKQIWVMFFIVFVDVAVTAVIYNIASKFVYSNSIARACFIFLLCTLMTSANKSLEEKKIFHRVENVLELLSADILHLHVLTSFQGANETHLTRGES